MKRVAYICADPAVPVFAARRSSLQVQEMLRALQRRGARVDLFAARLGAVAPPDLEQVAVHTLAPLPKAAAAERERAALANNAELTWLLSDAGPFDLIYERQSLWSYAGMEAAAAAGIPGVLEVNTSLIEEQIEYSVLVDRASAEQVGLWACGSATLVRAATRSLAQQLQRRYACDVVRVAPTPVNPQRYPERSNPFELRRANTFLIGFTGSLGARHGLPLLLDAFARLHSAMPYARLQVIADGPERDAFLADVDARGLRNVVQVTGTVPADEVPEQLARLDAVVLPRDADECGAQCAFTSFEAMAAGVPIVICRGNPAADLVEHTATGLLCAAEASAVAQALELIAGNARLRARLSTEARAHVLRHHTWDAAALRVLELASVSAAPLPAA